MNNTNKDILDDIKVTTTEGEQKLVDNNLIDRGNLLTGSDSTSDVSTKAKQVFTEVTSIAQEDIKSGNTTKVPNIEELVKRAGMSFIINRQNFAQVFKKLNEHAKQRVALAILDIPTDDILVELKTEEEMMAFGFGQKCQNDKFIIIQHHINEQIKDLKSKQQTENKGE